jgi:ABC-2 type transport system ATP-binding protein
MEPILELKAVRKTYGDFVAVEGLDLRVPPGAIYGFLGPNGAGKTTTIRMIMHIYVPDSGTITLKGQPIDRSSVDRIGYLPEERGLYKKMRVRDHVVYLGQLKGMDGATARHKADEWLQRMGLADRALAKVDELSKGMQQKLQFIGCILPEPEVLVLDEPFSGLDPVNVKVMREAILEFRRSGRTVLFSTHMMETAEQLCDHIFLIHRGRKVLDGPLDAILDAYPVDSITAACDAPLEAIERIPQVEAAVRMGNEVRVRLKAGADHQRLLAGLMQAGRVDRFSAVRPALTEIFIREVEGAGLAVAGALALGGEEDRA